MLSRMPALHSDIAWDVVLLLLLLLLDRNGAGCAGCHHRGHGRVFLFQIRGELVGTAKGFFEDVQDCGEGALVDESRVLFEEGILEGWEGVWNGGL